MLLRLCAAWLVLLSAACDSYPRDIEGTRERVESSRIVRVGMLASLGDRDRRIASVYLARLQAVTGAAARLQFGSGDPLLARLEAGELDLVIADVAEDSPWIRDAAIIEPLDRRSAGTRRIGLSPIARNGENSWIMLLERLARDQANRQ